MEDEIVTLATFSNPFEAEHAKDRLEEAGIRVFQSGQETNSLFAGLGGAFAQVQLHVHEGDLTRAHFILSRPEDEEPEAEVPIDTAIKSRDEKHPPGGNGEAIQTTVAPLVNTLAVDAYQAAPPAQLPAYVPEASDDLELNPPNPADALAERAWRAALFGTLIFPGFMHLYSISLLLRLSPSTAAPSPAGLRKVFGAILIDILVLGGIVLALASWRRW